MRKFFLSMVLFSFIGCGILSAQNTQSEPQRQINYEELIQQRVDRMEKILVLDDQTAEKFCPLYKEYLQALRKCYTACPVKDRTQLTDADREARIQHQMECRQKMLDTEKSYYPKFKKILNAKQMEKVFCHGNGRDFRSRGYYNHHDHRRGPNSAACDGTRQYRHDSNHCLRD